MVNQRVDTFKQTFLGISFLSFSFFSINTFSKFLSNEIERLGRLISPVSLPFFASSLVLAILDEEERVKSTYSHKIVISYYLLPLLLHHHPLLLLNLHHCHLQPLHNLLLHFPPNIVQEMLF